MMKRHGRISVLSSTAFTIAITSLLALATPAGAVPPHVNLIERANFEVPIEAGAVARLFEPGSHIGPWLVSGATVGVGRPFPGIVSGIRGRNLQFAVLRNPIAPGAMGTVCQHVDLNPSEVYRLRFYSAAATLDDTLIVNWQGRTVAKFAEIGSIGETNWVFHQVVLGPAAGANDGVVCFTGQGDGYPLVDSVNVHSTTP
jgi:hypothetical protein